MLRRFCALVLSISILLGLTGCNAQTLDAPAISPGLHAGSCHFDVSPNLPTHDCLDMVVPENPEKPSGRQVSFPVVYFHAPSSENQTDRAPILHLGGGGPGAAMISGAYVDIEGLLRTYSPMSLDQGIDLIVVDPRGSGAASPELNCPEIAEGFATVMSQADTTTQTRQLNALSHQCYLRLRQQGVGLEEYRSERVAQDMEALRKALGIQRWHLYGISYGTRYALTLIREVPDSIISAVLDSPVFAGVNYGERAAIDFSAAFQQVFARCEQHQDCGLQHPQLAEHFWRLIAKFNAKPMHLEMQNPHEDNRLPYTLSGDTLLNILFINLYAPGFADALPTLIQDLERNHFKTLTRLAENWYQFMTDPDFSDGSYNSHVCADEEPFVNGERLAATYDGLPATLAEIMRRTHEDTLKFCTDVWPVKPSGDNYVVTPVKTSLPILILQGALDPAVNASYLTAQSRHFEQAFWQIFQNAAHDVISSEPEAGKAAGCFFATGRPCGSVKTNNNPAME